MSKQSKIVFITGTDTGVGKTLFTALLLDHLRSRGLHALAMKPFCSGGTGDVRLLQSLQRGELTDEEANPFYYEAPIAPMAAAGRGRQVNRAQALAKIRAVACKCEVLLVEGSGGLMVPLGPDFMVADLISSLECSVIVVGRNRLGTINHTLLTVGALEARGVKKGALRVVLMGVAKPDLSAKSNARLLKSALGKDRVGVLPYLGGRAVTFLAVKRAAKRSRRLLIWSVNRWLKT